MGAAVAVAMLACSRRPRCYSGKNIVITGGSRGLGLELARHWGSEGANVAICSRDADGVERAVACLRRQGINAIGQRCDIRNEADCQAFIEFVRAELGSIDVLVNNAGIIQVGPMDCMTPEDFEDSLATHFWGPLSLIRLALPEMRRRRNGQIVNVSSIGGRISVPHLVPYCVGKFALVSLSEGLAAEFAKEGVSVITVTPGLMRTGSARNAQFKGQNRAEYTWFSISDSLPAMTIASTTAARRIVNACRYDVRCPSISLSSYLASASHGLMASSMTTLLEYFDRLLPRAGDRSTESHAGRDSTSTWSPSILTALNEVASVRNLER